MLKIIAALTGLLIATTVVAGPNDPTTIRKCDTIENSALILEAHETFLKIISTDQKDEGDWAVIYSGLYTDDCLFDKTMNECLKGAFRDDIASDLTQAAKGCWGDTSPAKKKSVKAKAKHSAKVKKSK